jgi:hypothetical protein
VSAYVPTVATLYLFANLAYFYAMTPVEVPSIALTSSVATEMLTRIFGAAAATFMSAGMFISSAAAERFYYFTRRTPELPMTNTPPPIPTPSITGGPLSGSI